MTEKERLLPKLVEEGWLAEVPGQHGTYSIGVRHHPPASRHSWDAYPFLAIPDSQAFRESTQLPEDECLDSSVSGHAVTSVTRGLRFLEVGITVSA